MYQSKEKIQTVVLLLADLICFVISYFGGGICGWFYTGTCPYRT